MKAIRLLPSLAFSFATLLLPPALSAAALPRSTTGNTDLDAYFKVETARVADRCLVDIKTLDQWKARRATYRQQLFEMLGLSPLPERLDLKATITGTLDHEQFTVEKLHYQSLPGFYVTANLYVPKGLTNRVPAILYVCGHGAVKKNGISYGNKSSYQHHGAWFARNGYVCLVVDTVQLGELEGIHHGTYREGMWWWNARGYTSAGAEAWNCIRALDYLQTRPEVDPNRLGVTGRSGGGAYSWWIAALDERIKCAVPVAGITDLKNHVVDGAVEGHCDCMFMVNTYRWDYAQVAALIAPRPLLLSNTDKDSIFPLDGVMRVHDHVKRIYDLQGAGANFGVLITEGPHKDTQDLQVPAFRWFNRFLKKEEPLIEMAAVKLFQPEQLRVFDKLPAKQRTTNIHDTFVPMATNAVPPDPQAWAQLRNGWMTALKTRCFAGWPTEEPGSLGLKPAFAAERDGVRLEAWDFNSQPHVRLRLYLMRGAQVKRPEAVILVPLDDSVWRGAMKNLCGVFAKELAAEGRLVGAANEDGFAKVRQLAEGNFVIAGVAPRGVGLTGLVGDAKKQVQIRRRFQLLGQTLDGMRVWDIQRAVRALRVIEGLERAPLRLHGRGNMGVNALYAALFIRSIAGVDLEDPPASHMKGPDYLNVLRFLDIPQAAAMAAERCPVRLQKTESSNWEYPAAVAANLKWRKGDALSSRPSFLDFDGAFAASGSSVVELSQPPR